MSGQHIKLDKVASPITAGIISPMSGSGETLSENNPSKTVHYNTRPACELVRGNGQPEKGQ